MCNQNTLWSGRYGLTLIFCFLLHALQAQTASFSGRVLTGDAPLPQVLVQLPQLKLQRLTDEQGAFRFDNLPAGRYTLQLSALGYRSWSDSLTLGEAEVLQRDFSLQEDMLELSGVVVTGNRNQVERYKTPVIINRITKRSLEAVQALSLSEGLSFAPGLRVENNCQNCGFTQLRMNGLDGPYSQILINSRPIFSALAGVYGLEMLPASMVERIEVVRGGGSVLYGGNAIAGTVNIITKDPIQNSFELGFNQSLINLETSDRSFNFNGALVSKTWDKGLSFFGFHRSRQPWDANGDGFSEITQLRNTSFGLDAFWNSSERGKLKAGLYQINEFRRGGNGFDLAPHQTDISEQLQHNILSSHVSYEHLSADYKHKFSAYASAQWVRRASYYGGGGRVLGLGDSLTEADILAINAYGNSADLAAVGGLQHHYAFSPRLSLTSGTEYMYNTVRDAMPGYGRLIEQRVGTWGTYAQLSYNPLPRLSFLLGGRLDQVQIRGLYGLGAEDFENDQILRVFVPRLAAMYELAEGFRLRASLAQGYRGPQAFDEDLHIETVGGAARFIRLAPDLQAERSNSGQLSLNYERFSGEWQYNLVLEGFYTQLNNPFILADAEELSSGISVVQKRNGAGAVVAGSNIEANIAWGRQLILQAGATLQSARYVQPELIWSPDDENSPLAAVTQNILRTPRAYGYYSLVYMPSPAWFIAYSGLWTGPMSVAHVINPETEQTVLKTTPSFVEMNLKLSYTLRSKDNYRLQFFAGVQNLLNSYQRDFDLGPTRDAGYVYGPLRPRTLFMGLKMGWN